MAIKSPARLRRACALLAIALSMLAAGCASTAPASPVVATQTPWAAATSTWQWNEHALDLIARNGVGQFPAARGLAYMNLAIHNALVQAASQQVDPGGAAAGAAAGVLAPLFPKEEAAIQARLQRETQALGAQPRARFAAGAEVGRQVAAQVVALAQSDRATAAWTDSVPTGEDKWSSRAQPPAPPLGPMLGRMRPFFLHSGADFRAPPPPPYGSEAFQAQVRKVREASEQRTNEQLRIAQYWENLTGSFGAGAWNIVARSAMAARGFDEPRMARTLALFHMVGVDATIACHDSKYVYWVPRPSQADPRITLAIGVPNHPSYPSNHACISGAMGRVLDAMLGDTRGQYEAMGRQAGQSRVDGGIHYPMDLDAGFEIARKVAARALEVGVAPDKPFVPVGR